MYTIKDKVVVITGASSGIGKALAATALAAGAKVVVCARNKEKLVQLFPASQQLLCIQADVSKEADCAAMIEQVIAQWGGVDVLINNAGISMRALFDEVGLQVLKELMDVNFWGAVYCTKYALPSLLKRGGVVASVSSIAGYRGLPCRTGYSASKFALQGFMESLRAELLHSGVHVMWVSPGFVSSNIRNVARNSTGDSQAESPLDEGKLMTPETCARIIIDGVQRRKRTIVMSTQGKLAVWLNKLFPAIADTMVYRHFMNEPDSPMKKYSTKD